MTVIGQLRTPTIMNESVLGVDADNSHEAARLYERCGFRVTQRNMVLRKSVRSE